MIKTAAEPRADRGADRCSSSRAWSCSLPVDQLRRVRSRSAPQGYRRAGRLPAGQRAGDRADVRIAGRGCRQGRQPCRLDPPTTVRWQRCSSSASTPRSRTTRARRYGSRRCWARPTWRSARHPIGRELPDGGRLPDAQVAENVDLDQILATFDPTTRSAFQTWMQSQARARERARPGHQRDVRRPCRRSSTPASGCWRPRLAVGGGPRPGVEHGRVLQRDQCPPGRAVGSDQAAEPAVCDDRSAQPGSGRGVHGAARIRAPESRLTLPALTAFARRPTRSSARSSRSPDS